MDYIVHRVTRNRTWLSDFHLRRSKLNFDEEFQREERIVVGKKILSSKISKIIIE